MKILLNGITGKLGNFVLNKLNLLYTDSIFYIICNETIPSDLPNNYIIISNCNMNNLDNVDIIINKLHEYTANIDIFINLAANFNKSNIDTINSNLLISSFNVNLLFPILLITKLKNILNDKSNIILISDSTGKNLKKEYISHSLSKAGLIDFTKLASTILAPRTRINCIILGPTIQGNESDILWKIINSKNSMKTICPIDTFINTLEYLIKTDFINGSIIDLTGN